MGPFHDFDRELWHHRRNGGRKLRPLVAAIGKQLVQEWILSEQRRDHQHPTVPILDIGRVNNGVQQQPYCIDKDMPLLAFGFLAGVIAVRVDAGPPFSALLTLWLSITHAVGLASRPACSRHNI